MQAKWASLLIPFIATFTLRAYAAREWIDLQTPHFEMFTDNGAGEATKALQTFEQVRYFFQQASKTHNVSTTPVRVIAFRSQSEFRPYAPNSGAVAYYQRSRKCDYIVMQDLSAEDHRVAVHEYTHLVIEHSGLKIPVWLNEGLADLYSSLEPQGNTAIVGRPITGHVMYLRTNPWMDTRTLFNVDPRSPYYNVPEKMTVFYAQSWAITHMILMDKRYKSEFSRFLSAVNSGEPSEQALLSIYGKTPEQLTADLQSYLRQTSVSAAIFDIKLPKKDLDPDVNDLSELKQGLALGDLLAAHEGTQSQARARLDGLAAKHPNNPDVESSLGYLAWQTNNVQEARTQFARAVKDGSKDAEMIYSYAGLEDSAGAPAPEVIDLLTKAVDRDSTALKYRLDLGLRADQAEKWNLALSQLSQVKRVEPEQAFSLFYTLALCHLQLKDLANARTPAQQALQYAKDPGQKDEVNRLIGYLDDAAKPPRQQSASAAEPAPTSSAPQPRVIEGDLGHPTILKPKLPSVSGTAKTFECAGKTFRLHLQVGAKVMVFDLGDPKDIALVNFKGDQLMWNCGPLHSEALTIVYDPSATSAKISGLVKEIVF